MKVSYISSLTVLALFLMLVSPSLAGSGTVIINSTGTITFTNLEVFRVQDNSSGYSQNSKVLWVNLSNTTGDTITFIMYNFSVSQVQEMRLNSTSKDAFSTNSTGVLTFTYAYPKGNRSMKLTPAISQGGVNATWSYVDGIKYSNSSSMFMINNRYNVTAARGKNGTVYHNNRSQIMWVTLVVRQLSSGQSEELYVNSSMAVSPTTLIAANSIVSSVTVGSVQYGTQFYVLPYNNYTVTHTITGGGGSEPADGLSSAWWEYY